MMEVPMEWGVREAECLSISSAARCVGRHTGSDRSCKWSSLSPPLLPSHQSW